MNNKGKTRFSKNKTESMAATQSRVLRHERSRNVYKPHPLSFKYGEPRESFHLHLFDVLKRLGAVYFMKIPKQASPMNSRRSQLLRLHEQ